jgi:hypothetical protein
MDGYIITKSIIVESLKYLEKYGYLKNLVSEHSGRMLDGREGDLRGGG